MADDKLQLLVIDDDEEDFLLVRDLLRDGIGAEVERAASADQALQCSQSSRYDALLLDYRLGARNGLDVLRELRHNDVASPVIFLTGHGDEQLAVEAMKSGAADYLSKSKLTLPSLSMAVRYAVNLRHKEEAVQAARRALQVSEQRFRTLVENGSDIITLVDAEGTLLYSSQSARRILGWAPEELIEVSVFAHVHPDDEPGLRQSFQRLLQAPGLLVRFEQRSRHKDGHYVMLESTAVNRLHDDSVRAIVINSRDITERRNLQEQLLHAQKIEAVGQLAGGVAHDFNNLLMVIGSYAELLRDGTPSTQPRESELQHNANQILEAVHRGAGLIRQLLAFSRKQVLSPRVLNLNDILAQLAPTLPRMLGEKVHVEMRPSPDLGPVTADPTQIEQVIINLAVNARDAMPQGGRLTLETSNLELSAEYARSHAGVQPGSYVTLTVTDTGEGIPPQVLPHIFEPFFTTKELGKGTGLGLSTVYGIMQQSGGFISVDSQAGQGAVFKIYLPKVDARCPIGDGKSEWKRPSTDDHRPSTGGHRPTAIDAVRAGASATETETETETILLVEDEDAVRDAVAGFLSLCGYRVLQAANGEEALRLAATCPGTIQLVITDLVMPGIGGSQMARQFQLLRPQASVLFMSGYTEYTAGQHGLGDSAEFLQKPFSLSVLAARIRQLLDRAPQTKS